MQISYGVLAGNAMAFALAFGWNDAAHKVVGALCKQCDLSTAGAALLYAVAATLIVVVIAHLVNRAKSRKPAGARPDSPALAGDLSAAIQPQRLIDFS